MNTSSQSLVSVVMTTYNHEEYIKEAIESVLMQKCDFEVELIIADDCSSDQTHKIVKSIIENHSNGYWVKYTRHIENKGPMGNALWTLKQAKGKYIAACEGDDYWTDPIKLQKQVDFLEKNEEVMLTNHFISIDIDKRKKLLKRKNSATLSGYFGLAYFLKFKNIKTLSIVFRVTENFKEDIAKILIESPNPPDVGDYPLFTYLLARGKGYTLREVMGHYRFNPASLSSIKRVRKKHRFRDWTFPKTLSLKKKIIVSIEFLKYRYYNRIHKIINR